MTGSACAIASEPVEVDDKTATGTKVTFLQVDKELKLNVVKQFLRVEFCWFLELMK